MVELLMVVVIMGILISLVLRASQGGIRRAEEKATITLIAKLEAALTDRFDAITTTNLPNPTPYHSNLAKVYATGMPGGLPPSDQRAQVIANYDHVRANLPDVFVVTTQTPTATKGLYPLNFGAATLPGTSDGHPTAPLPIGSRYPLGADDSTVPTLGMYGASFGIAAGIYSQLGYAPAGTDGADNNGDGYIDDAFEGLGSLDATRIKQISDRLKAHDHKTARAEMLYAVLVLGVGPHGSSFSREDFSNREVGDTDGDGLMEFIDAYGEPIQWFRWPLLFHSDTQRGFPNLEKIGQDLAIGASPGPYVATKTGNTLVSYEQRETNPLDPNNLLLSPAWWTKGYNTGSGGGDAATNASGAALIFQTFFHTLCDPIVSGYSPTNWDRSPGAAASSVKGFSYGSLAARRAYYSRFLVLSGGPDKMPGVARLQVDYRSLDERYSATGSGLFPLPGGGYGPTRDSSGGAVGLSVANVIQIENQGGAVDPNREIRGGMAFGLGPAFKNNGYRNDTNTLLEQFGEDDITSQGIQAVGSPLK